MSVEETEQMNTETLSVLEAAQIVGCEKETVYRAIWRGHLPARRRGNPRTGRLLILRTDFDKWRLGNDYADERRTEQQQRESSGASTGGKRRSSGSNGEGADKRTGSHRKELAKGY